MSTLDDVLADKPVTTEVPKEPAEPAEPGPKAEPDKGLAADGQPRTENRRREHQKREWEAQGRDPATGQFVKKDTQEAPKEPEKKSEAPKAEPAKAAEPAKPAAPPQEEMTPRERAAFAKAADETRKRQALEQELAQLRSGQPAKPAEPAKTFWDNPDAALKSQQQQLATERVNIRLQTAEMIARSRYTDLDEKLEIFRGLVQQNPGLVQPWITAADPAEYAYRLAKNHQELQAVGGLEEMRKKIADETAAKVRAEEEAKYKAKLEEHERQRAALPPTLSDVRGASTGKAAVWGGPTPLSDVLGKPN